MNIDKKKNLILFIHGFTGSKDTWESTTLEKRIPKYLEENAEIRENFDFDYFNYFTKLSDKSEKQYWVFSYLKNKIKKKPYVKLEQNLSVNVIKDKLCTDIEVLHKGYKNIILIAHSMGGLVAKASILKFLNEGNNRISGFVSLAVPHKGTNLALLGNFVLSNPNTKDLEALYAQSEDIILGQTSQNVQAAFGLSEERSMDVARLMTQLSQYKNKSLTTSELNMFSKELLNVSYNEWKAANQAPHSVSTEALIERAARANDARTRVGTQFG